MGVGTAMLIPPLKIEKLIIFGHCQARTLGGSETNPHHPYYDSDAWSPKKDSRVVLNDFNLLQWGFNRLIPARSPYSGVNMSLGMAAPKQRFIGSLSAGFCACGAGPRGFESRRFRRFELPTYTLFACRVIRISGSSVERRELVDVMMSFAYP
jgi:hypothetical protein